MQFLLDITCIFILMQSAGVAWRMRLVECAVSVSMRALAQHVLGMSAEDQHATAETDELTALTCFREMSQSSFGRFRSASVSAVHAAGSDSCSLQRNAHQLFHCFHPRNVKLMV